jgi:hypothetical protein
MSFYGHKDSQFEALLNQIELITDTCIDIRIKLAQKLFNYTQMLLRESFQKLYNKHKEQEF